MSVEENKAIAQRFIEAANSVMGNPDKMPAYIEEFFVPEFVCHLTTGDIDVKQFAALEHELSDAFPDTKHLITNLIADEDFVVIQRTGTMTHKGTYLGIAPTGKVIEVTGVDICRVVAGKFTEMTTLVNEMSIMQQLGTLPPTEEIGK